MQISLQRVAIKSAQGERGRGRAAAAQTIVELESDTTQVDKKLICINKEAG